MGHYVQKVVGLNGSQRSSHVCATYSSTTRSRVGRKEDNCYPISLVTEQDPSKKNANASIYGTMILIHLGLLMMMLMH